MAEPSTLANFTSYAAAFCYALGILLVLGKSAANRLHITLAAGWVAVVFHALGLFVAWLQQHGVSSSFYDAFSLTALIVVIATLLSQRGQPLATVLLPLYSIAAVCILLSIHLGHFHPIEAPSRGMLIHIVSSITAYALLCVSALNAVVLIITDTRLRNHRQLWALTLPPLQQTESTLFYTLRAGWLVLTLAIISGLIFVDNLFAQQLAHKTVFTLLAWLLFTTLLIGHQQRGWRGRTAAMWMIGGFGALMLAYLGSKFVLDVLLGRL